jgi:hypothetical protein
MRLKTIINVYYLAATEGRKLTEQEQKFIEDELKK